MSSVPARKRVTKTLVLTTEPLPLRGSATTGAGLRAWGLAEALRAAGLDVIIATPLHGDDTLPEVSPGTSHVRFFRRDSIGSLLDDVQPDVVVLQHWGLASQVPELSVPLVIDLAGPHLLERTYWGNSDSAADLEEKLAALRRADFVTCSGYFQRHYFYPFLLMAGFDLRKAYIPIIPFSVPPASELAVRHNETDREITFVYGGAFLAWQDPTHSIAWLLQEMDDANAGRLLFYGGTHPVIDASGGRFTELAGVLANHPRVEMRGWKPFDQLLFEYQSQGDVALDLMARNPERELAFTTRTMIYLHCGLPVIYNDYSEVSEILRDNDAGWTLAPNDESAFRTLVRQLIKGEMPLNEYRKRALQAAAQYDWTKSGTALVQFCRDPRMREGRVEFALALEHKRHQCEQSIAPTANGRVYLAHLLRKLPVSRLLSPFVYVFGWLFVLYMRLRLRKSMSNS